MCLACEDADMYYRWQLIQQIAKGEMPDGHTIVSTVGPFGPYVQFATKGFV
jgi:hypothetical protein